MMKTLAITALVACSLFASSFAQFGCGPFGCRTPLQNGLYGFTGTGYAGYGHPSLYSPGVGVGQLGGRPVGAAVPGAAPFNIASYGRKKREVDATEEEAATFEAVQRFRRFSGFDN